MTSSVQLYNTYNNIYNNNISFISLECVRAVLIWIIEQINCTASRPWAAAWFGTWLNGIILPIILKRSMPLHVIHKIITKLYMEVYVCMYESKSKRYQKTIETAEFKNS